MRKNQVLTRFFEIQTGNRGRPIILKIFKMYNNACTLFPNWSLISAGKCVTPIFYFILKTLAKIFFSRITILTAQKYLWISRRCSKEIRVSRIAVRCAEHMRSSKMRHHPCTNLFEKTVEVDMYTVTTCGIKQDILTMTIPETKNIAHHAHDRWRAAVCQAAQVPEKQFMHSTFKREK